MIYKNEETFNISKELEDIILDINHGITNRTKEIKLKCGDRKSRVLAIQLTDNEEPFDLTGLTARMYVLKPDNTKVFLNADITIPEYGNLMVTLTEQVLSVAGKAKCEIVLTSREDYLLSTSVFQIKIEESINDRSVLESTDDFSALVDTLSQFDGLQHKMHVLKEEIEEKKVDKLKFVMAYDDIKGSDLNKEIESTLENYKGGNLPEIRGFNIWKARDVEYNRNLLIQALEDIAELNCNTLFINDRALGRLTGDQLLEPEFTYDEIRDIVSLCKSKGYKVGLKPMIDPENGSRFYFQPGVKAELFFKELETHLVELGKIGAEYGIETLILTSETPQLCHYFYEGYWNGIINSIKKVYNGKLGVDCIYNTSLSATNDYDYNCLIDKVDDVMFSFYPTCEYEGVYTFQDIYEGISKGFEIVHQTSQRLGKKVLLGETGLAAVEGALKSGDVGGAVTSLGEKEQDDFFKVLHAIIMDNTNVCSGLMIWDIRLVEGYTQMDIRGKKTFGTIKRLWEGK